MSPTAAGIAAGPTTAVAGTWQRHLPARYRDQGLIGRRGYGRWGTAKGFPVLYLGSPRDSVVVEAYRHLIDPVEDQQPMLVPRVLVTVKVAATEIVDLRTAGGRLSVGLTVAQLTSPTNDLGAYAACQEVAAIAHQLGRHGLITPAASAIGETLVLFSNLLPEVEKPARSADDEFWEKLPADPRKEVRPELRIVRNEP